MKLRDYQLACADGAFREWSNGSKCTLIVAPTGSGKTVIIAEIIRRVQPKRTMFVAHREELIWQAQERITRVTGLECSIEMGDMWTNNALFAHTPVVISTIQTQNSKHGDRKRMGRFKPEDFGLLVIDEGHHIVADSYKNLINYYCQNPDLKVLTVTATPDRADEEALGQVVDSVAYDYEILDAINDGWLVPVEQQFVEIEGLDFSHMRTTAGDLNGADLAAVMEAESNLQGVAGAAINIIGHRRTIVFTASVKQAEVLSNIFNRHRPGMSEWVCGATNKDVRREMLGRFEQGKIQVVCNCAVLSEGFDNPGVECIVMAKPTKSRALYSQMAGRAMRPLPGLVDGLESPDERRDAIAASTKPAMTVLDFVGNSGKHKLMSSADILGGKVSDDVLEKAVEKAKQLGKPVRMAELIDETDEEVRKEAEERRQREEARKARLVAKVQYTASRVNPFDVFEMRPVRERGWDSGRTLSEAQKHLLLKQGINPDQLSYSQGRQLISEQFRRWKEKLCTLRQATLLKKFQYETRNLKFDEASRLITSLKANGWKRPAQEVHPMQSDAPDDRVPF